MPTSIRDQVFNILKTTGCEIDFENEDSFYVFVRDTQDLYLLADLGLTAYAMTDKHRSPIYCHVRKEIRG